jgi:hypothetical protein
MILKLRMQNGSWKLIDEIEAIEYKIVGEPRDLDLLKSRE